MKYIFCGVQNQGTLLELSSEWDELTGTGMKLPEPMSRPVLDAH